jgi:hypothetical protein
MFRKPSDVLVASSSGRFAFLIDVSTLFVDSRPWWHSMHRPSGPTFAMERPEGNLTDLIPAARSLWHAAQSTDVPVRGAVFTTPLSR